MSKTTQSIEKSLNALFIILSGISFAFLIITPVSAFTGELNYFLEASFVAKAIALICLVCSIYGGSKIKKRISA